MLYSGCVRASRQEFRNTLNKAHDNCGGCTIALDKRSAKSFIRINDRIRAREIRVIDENGEQLGILAPFEALKIARERGLDLVEVSPNAVPPVCRIQDYGRFLYEKEKSRTRRQKEAENHRRQGSQVLRHRRRTRLPDQEKSSRQIPAGWRQSRKPVSVSAAARWLIATWATTSSIRLIQDIGETGVVEFMPRMEGTILHAIIAPNKRTEVPKPKPPAPPQQPQQARPPAPPQVQ